MAVTQSARFARRRRSGTAINGKRKTSPLLGSPPLALHPPDDGTCTEPLG
jgi:hypothetical protein